MPKLSELKARKTLMSVGLDASKFELACSVTNEVWLTEKGSDGATRLGALADFAGERVRRSVNLESAYLHGRFGALPDVDRTELLRSLGLIS